jgi:hypothetical protein
LILQLIDRTLEPGEVLARDESCQRALYVVDGGVRLDGTSLQEGQAAHHAGALACQAPEGAELLVWELCREADPSAVLAEEVVVPGQRLLRCDRVDFPPGGVAYLHTHQGPGIRRLVLGAFRVETAGVLHDIPLGGAWFEAGPEPVYAEVVGDSPAAFVRVMVLPRELLGKSSFQFVNEEDKARPRVQQYKIFTDMPIASPKG